MLKKESVRTPNLLYYLYFPAIRNISLFFKTTKMYIFPTYFAQRNFRRHFLCKFFKALAKKICDTMWG